MELQKVFEDCEAGFAGLLRVELHTEDIVLLDGLSEWPNVIGDGCRG